ncbi:MAG: GNAT family N-acetyltransferase [Chloroflexota bacterium]
MELARYDSVDRFLAAAGWFLTAREAEHNLPLGILGTLRDHPEVYPEPPYLAVVRDGGAIALVAVRTPPHNLIVSEGGVAADRIAAATAVLVSDVRAVMPDLPGVTGPKATAGPFVEHWSVATGSTARLVTAERAFRLSRVIPPPAPAGSWRLAEERDRSLLAAWLLAFHREALPKEDAFRELDATVDRWIRGIDRQVYLWEVDGRVVSMVGAGSPTPNGIRIGPVYTPPEARGRGYASALTAATSQDQLDRGRRFCFLFTDLANPTSNHIYQTIGYEPVTDIDMYRFDPPADGQICSGAARTQG